MQNGDNDIYGKQYEILNRSSTNIITIAVAVDKNTTVRTLQHNSEKWKSEFSMSLLLHYLLTRVERT